MNFDSIRKVLLVVPAAVLVACGGGGSDSGSGGSDPGLTSTLAVSTSNAASASADGLDAATNPGGGTAALPTGVQVTGSGTQPRLSSVVRTLAGLGLRGTTAVATGVAIDIPQSCSLGGTIRITGSVANGSVLLAGDTLTTAAANCTEIVDGVATTLNGSITLTVVSGSFTGNAYPERVVMNTVATNLSTSAGGLVNVTNGDMRMDLHATSATTSTTILTGSSLSNSYSRSGFTRTVTMRNYEMTQSVQNTAVTTTTTATVQTNNPRLGGSTVVYQLSTPQAVVTDNGNMVVSGIVLVVGANNSKVRVTVTSVDNFLIQVDANGDGTYENSSTATLTDLMQLL